VLDLYPIRQALRAAVIYKKSDKPCKPAYEQSRCLMNKFPDELLKH